MLGSDYGCAIRKQASLRAPLASIGRVSSVYSPAERCFRDGSVGALAVPLDTAKLVVIP